MRVLLEYAFDHPTAERLYAAAAARLRSDGHHADSICTIAGADLGAYDLLLSHGPLSTEALAQPGLRCFGGRPITRVAMLEILESLGIPTMKWSRAADRTAVLALFDRWDADALIVKRSHSFGGHGTACFDRGHLDRLEAWDAEVDIFCPIVNPRSGTVYKAELFHGDPIHSRRCPSRPVLGPRFDGYTVRLRGSLDGRARFPLAPKVWRRLSVASAELTRRGFGYCSFDMMRTPRNQLVAIEVNTEFVATWWSWRFRSVTTRFVDSVSRFIAGIES